MSILITGGAGYIGSHTCVKLIEQGYDIVVVDNLDNSSEESLKRVKRITNSDFAFYKVDLRDKEALDKVFSDNDISSVIHFAGLKAVGESVEKPIEYYDNNLISTIRLLYAMRKYGVKKLIFSSSATVYSADNQMPLTESARLGCINPYGWTKYMIEQILKDTARANPDMGIVLLRYFNPIGAHESGLIGEDPNGIPNNLVPFITQTAIGRRDKLNVFGDDYDTPDGTGVRDYIHVVDLAQGHVAALKYADKLKGADAINLGTGTGYSVFEMVRAFERVNNVKVPYRIAPRRAGDVATVYSDPSKAKQVLGWTAEKTLEDMCRDSWNWQKQNPGGYK